jgi:hypothetical protein
MALAASGTLGVFPPRAFLMVAILLMFTLSLVIIIKRRVLIGG